MASSATPVRSFFTRPGDESSSATGSENESDDDAEGMMRHSQASSQAVELEDGSEDQSQLTQAELDSFSSKPTLSSLSNSIRNAARLSISNRLHSIYADASFVQRAAEAYALPLVANERCGSWYVPAELKKGSCYFKSTDGHFGCWGFSRKRLNVNVLDIVGENDGCIIVDSTRRGKSMPDALSKTIPIWCAVLNTALFGGDELKVYLPPSAVSQSEASQIEQRLGGFVESFKKLDLNISSLREKLKKPLRPIWVTPSNTLPTSVPCFPEFHPVILLTASNRDTNKQGEVFNISLYKNSSYNYIQGAGDDSESWARGLTAKLFWSNKDELLAAKEAELPDIIWKLTVHAALLQSHLADEKDIPQDYSIIPRTNGRIAIGDIASAIYLLPKQSHPGDNDNIKIGALIDCTASSTTLGSFPKSNTQYNKLYRVIHGVPVLSLPLPPGKKGNRILRQELGRAIYFAQKVLNSKAINKGTLMVVCETGNDHSVGIILAIISCFFDDNGGIPSLVSKSDETTILPGNMCTPDFPSVEQFNLGHEINKSLLNRRLGWIVSERPRANPSRSTLLAINSWLMRPG